MEPSVATTPEAFAGIQLKYPVPKLAGRLSPPEGHKIDPVMLFQMIVDHPHRIAVPGAQIALAVFALERMVGVLPQECLGLVEDRDAISNRQHHIDAPAIAGNIWRVIAPNRLRPETILTVRGLKPEIE